jgi:hypothetical protein
VGIGEDVAPGPGGRPLAILHARDESAFERGAQAIRAAFAIGDRAGGSATVLEIIR